jgi:hypothetical protein
MKNTKPSTALPVIVCINVLLEVGIPLARQKVSSRLIDEGHKFVFKETNGRRSLSLSACFERMIAFLADNRYGHALSQHKDGR